MSDVQIRNLAPYGARMRWPDPTTPGNLTKATYKGCGCASCGSQAPSFGRLVANGMRGLGALDDATRALPMPSGYAISDDPVVQAEIDREREASMQVAKTRISVLALGYGMLSVGAGIGGFVHGYNRNRKSVGWGLVWGLFGLAFPPLALGWMRGQKAK